jgi:hypothetical protein
MWANIGAIVGDDGDPKRAARVEQLMQRARMVIEDYLMHY